MSVLCRGSEPRVDRRVIRQPFVLELRTQHVARFQAVVILRLQLILARLNRDLLRRVIGGRGASAAETCNSEQIYLDSGPHGNSASLPA